MPENLTPTSRASRLITLALLVVILVGLQFRLSVVLGTEVNIPLRGDAGQYFTYAYNLRNHGVYSGAIAPASAAASPPPDHLRNPGYSLLILPFAGGEPSDAALLNITLLQAALSAAVILLIYLVARATLPPSGRPGRRATDRRLSPHLINANVYILSESAAVLYDDAIPACFLFIAERKARADGLARLVALRRPACAGHAGKANNAVVPAAALALLYLLPGPTRVTGVALWFIVGFLLTMAPWWMRNLHPVRRT